MLDLARGQQKIPPMVKAVQREERFIVNAKSEGKPNILLISRIGSRWVFKTPIRFPRGLGASGAHVPRRSMVTGLIRNIKYERGRGEGGRGGSGCGVTSRPPIHPEINTETIRLEESPQNLGI